MTRRPAVAAAFRFRECARQRRCLRLPETLSAKSDDTLRLLHHSSRAPIRKWRDGARRRRESARGRTDGPEAARPAEPVGTLRAGKSGGSAKSHGGKIRRAGEAALL